VGAKRRESFRPPFSKGGRVQRQRLWSRSAEREIPCRAVPQFIFSNKTQWLTFYAKHGAAPVAHLPLKRQTALHQSPFNVKQRRTIPSNP